MDKWIARVQGMSATKKALAMVVIVLLLIAVGLGKWALDLRAEANQEKDASGATASASHSAEPVSPVEEESTEGAEETPEPTEGASKVPQEDSAKQALKKLVPVWASLKYSETGTDSAKWQESWRDMPEAGDSLVTQSDNNFVPLFRGIIALNADAKVDTLKDMELVWQKENLSGWTVQMDRHLTSSDGSGALDETEKVTWEFTVEQKDDGSSQVTGYSAAADNSDH